MRSSVVRCGALGRGKKRKVAVESGAEWSGAVKSRAERCTWGAARHGAMSCVCAVRLRCASALCVHAVHPHRAIVPCNRAMPCRAIVPCYRAVLCRIVCRIKHCRSAGLFSIPHLPAYHLPHPLARPFARTPANVNIHTLARTFVRPRTHAPAQPPACFISSSQVWLSMLLTAAAVSVMLWIFEFQVALTRTHHSKRMRTQTSILCLGPILGNFKTFPKSVTTERAHWADRPIAFFWVPKLGLPAPEHQYVATPRTQPHAPTVPGPRVQRATRI